MSDWFDGLKWAERFAKEVGHAGLLDCFMGATDGADDYEFEQGVLDYIDHTKRLEAIGVQLS